MSSSPSLPCLEDFNLRPRVLRICIRAVFLEIPPPEGLVAVGGLLIAPAQKQAPDTAESRPVGRVDLDGLAEQERVGLGFGRREEAQGSPLLGSHCWSVIEGPPYLFHGLLPLERPRGQAPHEIVLRREEGVQGAQAGGAQGKRERRRPLDGPIRAANVVCAAHSVRQLFIRRRFLSSVLLGSQARAQDRIETTPVLRAGGRGGRAATQTGF